MTPYEFSDSERQLCLDLVATIEEVIAGDVSTALRIRLAAQLLRLASSSLERPDEPDLADLTLNERAPLGDELDDILWPGIAPGDELDLNRTLMYIDASLTEALREWEAGRPVDAAWEVHSCVWVLITFPLLVQLVAILIPQHPNRKHHP